MAFYHTTPPSVETPPQYPGTGASVKQFLAAGVRYAEARVKLLSLEARLAAHQMKSGLLMMGVAAILVTLSLAILMVAGVLLLMQVLPQGNGAAACGVAAGVMLLISLLLVLRGRKAMKTQNFFPVTKSEYHIDQQWLKHP